MTTLVPKFYEQAENCIEKVCCVSFDFFDTLFWRPLADPEDVFELIERQLAYPNFKQKRQTAQAIAFQKMAEQARQEITFSEIYQCFNETDAACRMRLMQAEYDLELQLIEPNVDMMALLKKCLSKGKRVIITSDMYLPEAFFKEALQQYELANLPLFISSEKNATKRDRGHLFDIVQKELSLPADAILHIGDNVVSDVVRAQERGLSAMHYSPPSGREMLRTPALEKSFACGLFRTCSDHFNSFSAYGELGFLYGGLASVGFLNWIQQQCVDDGIEHLLFLARDGYVLDRLAHTCEDFRTIHCHYFLGSRVVFTLAAMTSENFQGFIPFLLSGADGLSVAELLERIGVRPPADSVMRDLGLGDELKINPDSYSEIAAFLRAYRAEILKVAALNRRGLYQSLQHLNIRNGCKVAMVDVGWSGTTQEALERAIAEMMHLDVQGYYFCLADTTKRIALSQRQKMRALLSSDSLPSDTIAALYQNRVAVEMMFSAPHHTVIGLRPGQHQVQSVVDPGRGLETHAADEILSINRDICEGIAAFARCYRPLARKLNLDEITSPLDRVKPLIELALSEGNDDIRLLQAVKNFDAWGSSRNHQLDLNAYRNA